MTVCVAAICRWNYDPTNPESTDWGSAIVTASDRMMTDMGIGIEYEPTQWKGEFLGKRMMLLVSGDITVHTEVLNTVVTKLLKQPTEDVQAVAELYALHLRQLVSRRAEREHLAVYGLTHETFLAAQKTMDPGVVMELSRLIAESTVDAEALVVGCDDTSSNIFSVNRAGVVRNHSAIGFATIGMGAVHSASEFMKYSFVNTWSFFPTMALTYSAKRRAEIAPGVGKTSDMFFITKTGCDKIDDQMYSMLVKAYDINEKRKRKIDEQTVKELLKFAEKKGQEASRA